MKDTLGFKIEGFEEAKTNKEKIKCLEAHSALMDGLHNELQCSLARMIHDTPNK